MNPFSSIETRLDKAIDCAIAQSRLVGAVVLASRNGETIYRRATGLADREANAPMREDTVFRLASISKPYVTAAAMRLAERGGIALGQPLTRWLPGFRPALRDGTRPDITLHQLLTHTSGLYYPFQEPEDGPAHCADVSNGLDLPGLSGPEAMDRLARVPLRFLPGTAYNYSPSLDVLGEFMAAATGQSLPEIVAATITGPLGMMDTTFAVSDASRLVTHYGVDANNRPLRMADTYWGPTLVSPVRMSPRRLFDAGSYASGGGGMAGTAGDFLRFLEALRLHGGDILKPASTRLMTTVCG